MADLVEWLLQTTPEFQSSTKIYTEDVLIVNH